MVDRVTICSDGQAIAGLAKANHPLHHRRIPLNNRPSRQPTDSLEKVTRNNDPPPPPSTHPEIGLRTAKNLLDPAEVEVDPDSLR